MGVGVRALIGETSVTLYAYQKGGSRIVGVASTPDATWIGRNGEVAEMDYIEKFICAPLD